MSLDYHKKYREAYVKNVEEVQKSPVSVEQKIISFCELHDFKPEDIKREIRGNKVVAALFAKDPQKQIFLRNVRLNSLETSLESRILKNCPIRSFTSYQAT